jgi:hypothetical protein
MLMFLLLLIKSLVDERCHNPELREPLCEFCNTGWAGNEVQEEDPVLRNSSLFQYLYSESCRTTWV